MQVNHHFVPGLVEVLIPFRTTSSEGGPKGGGAHQGVLEKKNSNSILNTYSQHPKTQHVRTDHNVLVVKLFGFWTVSESEYFCLVFGRF